MQRPLLLLLVAMAVGLPSGCTSEIEVRKMLSAAMEPTIPQGTQITIDYGAYADGRPSRGQIVAFQIPGGPQGRPGISRVMGTGGDTLQVAGGELYVNDMGSPVDEPYIAAPMTYELDRQSVPDGYVFVLSDNRNEAFDSHYFGSLPLDRVVGRVIDIGGPER